MVELLMVVALMGLALAASAAAWQNYRRSANLTTAAHSTKMAIYRARLLSVFRNVNHFVVLDSDNNTLSIFEDSSIPLGSFDAGDTLVSRSMLPSSAPLGFPAETDTLANPLSGAAMSSAWSLPDPDSTAEWGANLKGLMTAPTGRLMSAEATPQVIGIGAIVFNDSGAEKGAVALGMEGRSGTVRVFRLANSSWVEI